jgi:hypothetical protein
MDPGSHVGIKISTKNTNLVEDHPVNIIHIQTWLPQAIPVLDWSISKNLLI